MDHASGIDRQTMVMARKFTSPVLKVLLCVQRSLRKQMG